MIGKDSFALALLFAYADMEKRVNMYASTWICTKVISLEQAKVEQTRTKSEGSLEQLKI